MWETDTLSSSQFCHAASIDLPLTVLLALARRRFHALCLTPCFSVPVCRERMALNSWAINGYPIVHSNSARIWKILPQVLAKNGIYVLVTLSEAVCSRFSQCFVFLYLNVLWRAHPKHWWDKYNRWCLSCVHGSCRGPCSLLAPSNIFSRSIESGISVLAIRGHCMNGPVCVTLRKSHLFPGLHAKVSVHMTPTTAKKLHALDQYFIKWCRFCISHYHHTSHFHGTGPAAQFQQ